MIAPLRQPDSWTPEVRRQLRAAREMVATTRLQPAAERVSPVPPVPRWAAWLFTTWLVLVTALYGAYMLGLL